jgi:hypothetical protein
MAQHVLILLDDNNTEAMIEKSKVLMDNNTFNQSKGVFVDGISHRGISALFNNSAAEIKQCAYDEILLKILKDNPLNTHKLIESIVQKSKLWKLRINVFLRDEDLHISSFIRESQYADVLIVGKEIVAKIVTTDNDISNIEQLLLESRCPVLLIASQEKPIENMVLLFDGSNISFQAIKMFVHLFSEQIKKTNIQLIVKSTEEANSEEKYLIDYIKSYKLHFSISRIDQDSYAVDLFKMLSRIDNFLLIAGNNRIDIVKDLMRNKNSYFMKEGRNVFMI